MKGWVYNEGIIKIPLSLFYKLFYKVREHLQNTPTIRIIGKI